MKLSNEKIVDKVINFLLEQPGVDWAVVQLEKVLVSERKTTSKKEK